MLSTFPGPRRSSIGTLGSRVRLFNSTIRSLSRSRARDLNSAPIGTVVSRLDRLMMGTRVSPRAFTARHSTSRGVDPVDLSITTVKSIPPC